MTIILVTLIFIRPFISSLAFPYANFIHSGLLLVLAAIWIVTRGVSLKENKLTLPVILFCLALFLSLILRYNNTAGAQELYKYVGGILVLLLCSSLPYKDKDRVILSIMLAGILISCLALYQYFFGFPYLNSYVMKEKITNPFVLDYIRQRRVFFPFVTPNTLGISLRQPVKITLPSKLALEIKCFILPRKIPSPTKMNFTPDIDRLTKEANLIKSWGYFCGLKQATIPTSKSWLLNPGSRRNDASWISNPA
ncbi:MAG: hypothetical protein PHO03_01385 [Candidatus Omnitrophica bacterium]|nr:hypothetical protein [Candidatus Omnitrophota bacterium]